MNASTLSSISAIDFNNAMHQFREAILERGMNPPDVIEPGKLYRFPGINKRPGNTAGWCKLFENSLGGCFGDWSSDFTENWQARREKPLSQTEREAFRRHVKDARAQAAAERKAHQEKVAASVVKIWEKAKPAPLDNTYLTRKRIDPHGVRKAADALIVPLGDGEKLYSLQFIYPDGKKRFIRDGRVSGCYFLIGDTHGAAALCVAEGFATGATIHQATGYPVFVAFHAGNLKVVAQKIRIRFPSARLIICADDDAATEGNPGITKATEAALAVDGIVVSPDFGANRPEHVTDFNDMAQLRGIEAVKKAITGAWIPTNDSSWSEPQPMSDGPKEQIDACPIHQAVLKNNGLERYFDEVLSNAKALTPQSDPQVIGAILKNTVDMPAISRRRVLEAIKASAKLPLSALNEALKESAETEKTDDLTLARHVIESIGRENILCTTPFVYHWNDSGVWRVLEDRAVKKIVQTNIEEKVTTLSKSTVESVTDVFKTELFINRHQFDVGAPDTVNCLNGELSLVTGKWQLSPHIREHYRTTQIPVAYDPRADAPRFKQFMREVFTGDVDGEDKTIAVLEMIGYTLMAHCRHERFVILVGTGANGKSKLLGTIEGLCGVENVSGVQPSMFDRSFQRAHLHGKLANIVSEVKQGEVIDDASLKSIVSGEPTTVEHKFKDPFIMRPFATCWFGTNHMPHTRDFSDALFRRALVIPFNNTFKPELGNCDYNLQDKLLTELPGILNLALTAYALALENGFTVPQSCLDAREEWRLEADQVAQFIEAECDIVQTGEIASRFLYDCYRKWADRAGIAKMVTETTFSKRLEMLGHEKKKKAAGMFVLGLTLKTTAKENDTYKTAKIF